METTHILRELRAKHGLSQDELAEKVYVTRQAVSRWENGETTPNTETLKLLSKEFDVIRLKRKSELLGGFRILDRLAENGEIFKDNIVGNFSDRFLCTGMTENTNVGLFTLPFKVPHKWLLQNAPNKITCAFPP